jgi:hypothetical protein
MSEWPGGWVPLHHDTFTQRLDTRIQDYSWFFFFMLVGAPLTSGGLQLLSVDPGASFVLGYVIAGAVAVLFFTFRALPDPSPAVDLSTDQLRVGRTIVELAAIDSAVLLPSELEHSSTLVLRLKSAGKTVTLVPLLRRNKVVLTEAESALWAEVLARTRVAMPTSADDPKGRFARYNFPGHVDKDTAIDLLLNPPRSGDPLPISF